jgi:2-dehydro-3-deoxygalactonokinase
MKYTVNRTDRPAAFIAGDWGTSAARFWLCAEDGAALDAREGAGIAEFGGDRTRLLAAVDAVSGEWPQRLPAVLCGMIGSNLGLQDSGSLDTPVSFDRLIGKAARLSHAGREIAIVPGLRTINRLGEPDVMRGEETQVAGACALAGLDEGIFALPGTHNKWVTVAGRRITGFQTAMTGEMFNALARHSILVAKVEQVHCDAAFETGTANGLCHKGADLLTLLFSTRTRQLAGQFSPAEAESYLSGLLIGSDVAAAAPLIEASGHDRIGLICNAQLGARYAWAIGQAGYKVVQHSGADCARIGLAHAWRHLFAPAS